jgi:hypothetical protein
MEVVNFGWGLGRSENLPLITPIWLISTDIDNALAGLRSFQYDQFHQCHQW